MSLRTRFLLLVIVYGSLCAPILKAAVPPTGPTASAPAGAAEGVLLLRSGRVLQGRISRDGNAYVVYVAGNAVRVDSDEARFACRSLEEAYEIQRQRLAGGDTDEHLRLARWCLGNGLIDEARGEVISILELSPEHAEARSMLERLPRKRSAAEPSETTTGPAVPESRGPRLRLGVLARKDFMISVQPVLMKSCAVAGCHDRNSPNEFTLTPLGTGRRSKKLGTEENLRAVLRFIDRNHPDASRLLLAPREPHASLAEPVFVHPSDPEYRQLVAWVYEISGQPVPRGAMPPRRIEPKSRIAAQPAANPLSPASAFLPGSAVTPVSPVQAAGLAPVPSAVPALGTAGSLGIGQPLSPNLNTGANVPTAGAAASSVPTAVGPQIPQAGGTATGTPTALPGVPGGAGASPQIPMPGGTPPGGGAQIPPANGSPGYQPPPGHVPGHQQASSEDEGSKLPNRFDPKQLVGEQLKAVLDIVRRNKK